MIFDDIIQYVEQSFDVEVHSERAANVLFLRVSGLDDVSLSRYIKEKFDVDVVTKKIEGYKLYNNDWIKITECGS